MDAIFLWSINSKKSDPHRLLLNFTNKINLKRKKVINTLLYQISTYTIHGNM